MEPHKIVTVQYDLRCEVLQSYVVQPKTKCYSLRWFVQNQMFQSTVYQSKPMYSLMFDLPIHSLSRSYFQPGSYFQSWIMTHDRKFFDRLPPFLISTDHSNFNACFQLLVLSNCPYQLFVSLPFIRWISKRLYLV